MLPRTTCTLCPMSIPLNQISATHTISQSQQQQIQIFPSSPFLRFCTKKRKEKILSSAIKAEIAQIRHVQPAYTQEKLFIIKSFQKIRNSKELVSLSTICQRIQFSIFSCDLHQREYKRSFFL